MDKKNETFKNQKMYKKGIKKMSSCAVQVVTYLTYYLLYTYNKRTLDWNDVEWSVRRSYTSKSFPGPTYWSGANVWVDNSNSLHMKITNDGGIWHSSQICSKPKTSFGKYTVDVEGKIDEFDPTTVLGFYVIATDTIDTKSNEIDIEIAEWSNPNLRHGNLFYAVRGNTSIFEREYNEARFDFDGNLSTHTFTWKSDTVNFQSNSGLSQNPGNMINSWDFSPNEYSLKIPQSPMHLCLNFWNHKGNVPFNGQPSEVIIRGISYISSDPSSQSFGGNTAPASSNALGNSDVMNTIRDVIDKMILPSIGQYLPENVNSNMIYDQMSNFFMYLLNDSRTLNISKMDINELSNVNQKAVDDVIANLKTITDSFKYYPNPKTIKIEGGCSNYAKTLKIHITMYFILILLMLVFM